MALARKYGDQNLSVIDCLSFAIMQRLGLQVAFTNDWHFRLPGFVCLPE